jgi:hypothetical protein
MPTCVGPTRLHGELGGRAPLTPTRSLAYAGLGIFESLSLSGPGGSGGDRIIKFQQVCIAATVTVTDSETGTVLGAQGRVNHDSPWHESRGQ